MSDSDAPRFQVGDKVRWLDDEREGIVTCIAPPDAAVTYGVAAYPGGPDNDVVSTCCELQNLTLVAPALYLDDEDVKALEIALDVVRVKRGIAPKHDATRRNPLGIPGRDIEERIDSIIARAKRAPAKTETNDG